MSLELFDLIHNSYDAYEQHKKKEEKRAEAERQTGCITPPARPWDISDCAHPYNLKETDI